MKPIGQCTGLAPDNIYLETNKNTSFPYHNQTSSSAGIDVDGNGTVVGNGGGGSVATTGSGFVNRIPILLMLGGALSSSSIYNFFNALI